MIPKKNENNGDNTSKVTQTKIEKNIINMNKKYKEITKEVKYDITSIKYNTPIIINYKEKIFKISTREYYDKFEYTYKCKYYRRVKDIPSNQKNI